MFRVKMREARFLRNVATSLTTRRHIPEESNLHSHRSENLRSAALSIRTRHTCPLGTPNKCEVNFDETWQRFLVFTKLLINLNNAIDGCIGTSFFG
jgi:hypothetical protein